MARKIYIDLGANRGSTIRNFRRENADFIVFGFEPTPALVQGLRSEFRGTDSNVHIMEYAAWIHDGIVNFYFGADSDQSSEREIRLDGRSITKYRIVQRRSILIDGFGRIRLTMTTL